HVDGTRFQRDRGTAGDDVRHHPVHARAQQAAVALESRTVDVVVDPHAAVVESVTFSQIQGRTITFYPHDGVARMPYAFQNDQKITVKIGFTGPVTNVRVQLG